MKKEGGSSSSMPRKPDFHRNSVQHSTPLLPGEERWQAASAMATPEERSPRFLKVIMPDTLQNGRIEIPQGFLKKYEKCLPKYACIEVSTGVMWKVELKRCQGRVYLHQGWQDFVEHCSIKPGYFVEFRYDGGSFFHAFIFDTTEMEIQYPVSAISTHRRADLDQSRDQEVEVDDDASVEILDEGSRKLHESIDVEDIEDGDNQEEEEETSDDDNASSYQTSSDKYQGEGHVTEGGNRPLQSARPFQSPNPYFIITMKPAYICGNILHIPVSHARTHFLGEENNGSLRLIGANGKDWSVGYSAQIGPTSTLVRLQSGWRRFAKENYLQAEDVCVFELIKSTPMTYKVTIPRVAEEGEVSEKAKLTSEAKKRVLERGKTFKSSKPHFMIRIMSRVVNIPMAYTRRYLKDAKRGKNVIILHGSNDTTWPVSYKFFASDQGRAKVGSGWTNFVLDNQLEAGDVCVFEMIGGKGKDYKVIIFRVADYVSV